MSRATLQTMADSYMAALHRRDPVALAEFHSIDCVAESPMFATLHGRAAIEESYRQLYKAFPDLEFKLDSLLIDPPRIAATTTNSGTHVNEFLGLPGTHKHFEFLLARIVTVKDGLITHERRIYDLTGLLVQLGVLKAKPAKA